jgi:hypothetical protein
MRIRGKVRASRADDVGDTAAMTIAVVVFLFMAFLTVPGMLLFFLLVAVTGIKPDMGQMWTFSILIDIGIYLTLWSQIGSLRKSSEYNLVASLILSASLLILRFGFKVELSHFWSSFFG